MKLATLSPYFKFSKSQRAGLIALFGIIVVFVVTFVDTFIAAFIVLLIIFLRHITTERGWRRVTDDIHLHKHFGLDTGR